ncbi:MAG: folate-binding protein [Xanthomonadales bacterium]|nr:folate-binding protein [Xanthomonadales bacterium]
MIVPRLAHTIEITGPDAVAFAHAQFSSPVNMLAVGQWQFSAWLDARGRVQALFHLARSSDQTLVMLLRGGDGEAVAAALRRFVFRSRVTILAAAPCQLHGGPAAPLHRLCGSRGTLGLGCGGHGMYLAAPGEEMPDWCTQQVRAGWPWLPAAELGQWLAPALSLLRLRAVVTDKGCYPGQEIVARLHFRGAHKQHLCSLASPDAMHAGEALCAGNRETGRVLDVVPVDPGFEALAVLDESAVMDFKNGRPAVYTSESTVQLQRVWPA